MTNSKDKSGRKWQVMNEIIVSFPLVFHVINLPECSRISVRALTEPIQALCCSVIQIAYTRCKHLHNTTSLLSSFGLIDPCISFHGNCLWWRFFVLQHCSLLSSSLHKEDYQPQPICQQSHAKHFTPLVEVIAALWGIRICCCLKEKETTLWCERTISAVFMRGAWRRNVSVESVEELRSDLKLKSTVSLIKQLPIWKGLPYPLSTRGCVKWIQLLWFPSYRHLLGWKHFFIITFNSMLGVPTVPLLRLRLIQRSFQPFSSGLLLVCRWYHFSNSKNTWKDIRLYPCYCHYLNNLHEPGILIEIVCYFVKSLCFGILL